MKYVVYYLEVRDFSDSDYYTNYRHILQEVDGESRFDTWDEAAKRATELTDKNYDVTVLPVFCV